ncbi:hypothetical protein ABEB36_004332 [Hypothenemus hampei]|uniref:UDP-glucuronosyltransferase n=1 Tax=Hypothenemus hampei TaxID=57062 RepID=A0ABD1F2Z2_HYPHA
MWPGRLIIYYCFILRACWAANILAIFPFPGYSHFRMFGSLMEELAKRGHDVDVVSHFPLKTPIPGYNDISVRGTVPIVTNNMTFTELRKRTGSKQTRLITDYGGSELCQMTFNELHSLKNTKKKYDVFITELFGSDCMLGWSWYFHIPSIIMTSSANLPWVSERFGLPDNPSYIPTYFAGYKSEMNLYERIHNTWTLLEAKFLYHIYSSRPSNIVAKKFFGEELPDLEVLAKETSLQLVNTHFSVNNVRPLVPNVIEVAGLHIQEAHIVNEHFDHILTTDKEGVIYFNMGSVVKPESLTADKIQALLNAFAILPFKVIWKGKREPFQERFNVPDNIHFEEWIPQQEILCDSRVKIFITHGGMMSSQEAVYCGIPILGIPLFADQYLNLKYAETMGYAIMVDYDDLSTETISSALKKLAYESQFHENAKRISAEFRDRPMSPMDTAVYWVEYVIRHKGTARLSSAARHLHWWQYYLLDVFAVIFVLPLLLSFILIKLIFFFKQHI